MNGLLFLIGVGILGFLVVYFLDLQFIFELGIALLLLVFVFYSRFSEAKWQFGNKKPGQWFSHTPGGGRYAAYTPRSWQGWIIFLLYFASFVLGPAVLTYFFPAASPGGFLIQMVLSWIATTSIYLLIAIKKS